METSIESKIRARCNRVGRCLIWQGARSKGGDSPGRGSHSHYYGRVWHEGRAHYVHRLMLQAKLGRRIRSGYHADHFKDCSSLYCEPSHLREALPRTNCRRAGKRTQVKMRKKRRAS